MSVNVENMWSRKNKQQTQSAKGTFLRAAGSQNLLSTVEKSNKLRYRSYQERPLDLNTVENKKRFQRLPQSKETANSSKWLPIQAKASCHKLMPNTKEERIDRTLICLESNQLNKSLQDDSFGKEKIISKPLQKLPPINQSSSHELVGFGCLPEGWPIPALKLKLKDRSILHEGSKVKNTSRRSKP